MKTAALPLIGRKQHLGPSYFLDELSARTFSQHRARGETLVPFFGNKIPCGIFGISDDFIEKYQSLDARFIKNKEATFFFKAIGDSMIPTIFPGEILVVDRSLSHMNHGRVCIVAYNGELVCKRIWVGPNFLLLRSDNRRYPDIRVDEPENALVWGIVIARIGEVQ